MQYVTIILIFLFSNCATKDYNNTLELVADLIAKDIIENHEYSLKYPGLSANKLIDTFYCDDNKFTLIVLEDSGTFDRKTLTRYYRQYDIYYYDNGQLAGLRVGNIQDKAAINPKTLEEFIDRSIQVDSITSFYFNRNRIKISAGEFSVLISECDFHKFYNGYRYRHRTQL